MVETPATINGPYWGSEDLGASRTEDLAAIDTILPRLMSRLSVTIRQASRGRFHTEARRFASDLDLRNFINVSQAAVQALYPNTYHSRQEYLAKTMKDRFVNMLYLAHRGGQFQSRRPRRFPNGMPTIGEDSELESGRFASQSSLGLLQKQPLRSSHDNASPYTPSESHSDLRPSTVSKFGKQYDEAIINAPTERRKATSSIQVSQGNYPPAPFSKDGNIAPCEWCGKPMDKREITETEWR